MKKVALLFACAIAFVSCQKQQYSTSVAAPKFEYHNETQNVRQADQPQVLKEETTTEATAAVQTIVVGIGDVPVVAVSNSNSETKAAVPQKKMTFKQRMITKIVAKKMQKANKQANGKVAEEKTNTIALIAGIAAIAGIVLLFVGGGAISLLLALGAIIMGFVGNSQIKNGKGKGRGWAITGIVGGFLVFFLLLLAVVLVASYLGGL